MPSRRGIHGWEDRTGAGKIGRVDVIWTMMPPFPAKEADTHPCESDKLRIDTATDFDWLS